MYIRYPKYPHVIGGILFEKTSECLNIYKSKMSIQGKPWIKKRVERLAQKIRMVLPMVCHYFLNEIKWSSSADLIFKSKGRGRPLQAHSRLQGLLHSRTTINMLVKGRPKYKSNTTMPRVWRAGAAAASSSLSCGRKTMILETAANFMEESEAKWRTAVFTRRARS